MVRVLIMLCIFVFSSFYVMAESSLPDNDTNGKNNSPGKAIDLGVIGQLQDGVRKPVIRTDNLGVVIGGFDTEDWYRFGLPAGKWRLEIGIRESPLTSQWFDIYDDTGVKRIGGAEGADNDETSVLLSGGTTYFIRVLTDKAVAAGRPLTYTLTILPTFLPNDDTGGDNCEGASDVGRFTDRTFNGALSSAKRTSTYRFYYPFEFTLSGTSVSDADRVFSAALNDLYGARFLPLIQRKQKDEPYVLLDPGSYCLVISDDYATSPENYFIKIGKDSSPDRLQDSKASAGALRIEDIGPFAHNGKYPGQRSISRQNGTFPGEELSPGMELYVREWVGPSRTAQWYRFTLGTFATIEFTVTGLKASISAELQDASGNILESVPRPGRDNEASTVLRMSRKLTAGSYFVKIYSKSTQGTAFQMLTKVSDPAVASAGR
jgi:hypothetical protein